LPTPKNTVVKVLYLYQKDSIFLNRVIKEIIMKKLLILLSFVISVPLSVQADNFNIKFDWSDLKLCNSGYPNIVKNPTFHLKNVPESTKWIYFKLVDTNVVNFNHGGGWVEYTGQDIIKPGEFTYKSPCPPNGSHKYEWTASARKQKQSWGKPIQKASSAKMYP